MRSPDAGIMAHPGLTQLSDAQLAAENGVNLEVSSRKGRSFANGHVATVAQASRAELLLDSIAHGPRICSPRSWQDE